eukprot:10975454-Alexandrium_andersonii.AAC.1
MLTDAPIAARSRLPPAQDFHDAESDDEEAGCVRTVITLRCGVFGVGCTGGHCGRGASLWLQSRRRVQSHGSLAFIF